MDGNHGSGKRKSKKAYAILLACTVLVLLCAGVGLVLQNGKRADQNTEAGYIYESFEALLEALGLAEKEREEVTYSYEELFGEMGVCALAVPAVPDPACFTYEELEDGTLRITGYDEDKNTGNPYQVIIPSELGGKPVSTLGTRSIHANDLVELVISEGITTLEKEVFASGWEPCLVALPDSVTHMDEDAFYPVIISCDSEAAYAYGYAMEHGFACRVANPAAEENAFLQDYAVSRHARLPYLCHIRKEGEMHDYIVIEYLDIVGQIRACLDSGSRFFPSDIWDYNEFAVLVLDRESGAVLQCIDSASFHGYPEIVSLDYLPYVHCQDILSVADWNFDGFPDLSLYQGIHGTGAVTFEAIFLFDRDSGTYVHADDFPSRNIYLRTDKQCIESTERGSAAEHYVYRYQYVDGVMTQVAALSLYELWENGTKIIGARDERLIDGEWQIYCEEKVILEDTASGDDVFLATDTGISGNKKPRSKLPCHLV